MPLSRIALILSLALVAASCTSQKQAQKAAPPVALGAEPLMLFDPIAHRLDSLAAISDGDYIHMQVGSCFGRCETILSIFRTSPAKFHIYEAEGWEYNEFDRDVILYRLRRPLRSDVAEGLVEKAHGIGIMKLVRDTTRLVTDHPYIWVRARIGGETLTIDRAYLGGERYMREGGLNTIYEELRKTLLAPLYGRVALEGK